MAMTQRSMTIAPQKADDGASRVLTMPLSKNWRLLLECAFLEELGMVKEA